MMDEKVIFNNEKFYHDNAIIAPFNKSEEDLDGYGKNGIHINPGDCVAILMGSGNDDVSFARIKRIFSKDDRIMVMGYWFYRSIELGIDDTIAERKIIDAEIADSNDDDDVDEGDDGEDNVAAAVALDDDDDDDDDDDNDGVEEKKMKEIRDKKLGLLYQSNVIMVTSFQRIRRKVYVVPERELEKSQLELGVDLFYYESHFDEKTHMIYKIRKWGSATNR
jgi:hypothetical protein